MHAPIFPGFKICTSNSLVKQNLPFVHPSPLKFICRQRPSFAHVLGSRVVCKFGRPRISNEAVVWALVFPCFSNHISLRSQRSSDCACNHPKCGNDCCISTCQGEMKDCPDGQNSVFSNLQCSRHCLGWSEFLWASWQPFWQWPCVRASTDYFKMKIWEVLRMFWNARA